MNNKNLSDYLSSVVAALPDGPGVYQFYNNLEQIIYVGKARNLKKRVSSYFQKSHHDNGKVRVMVNKITDIKFIVVGSESDALLLENNLIKKYQPRYNILLKDDKTFPWICIKNENFPRVFSTRNVVKDGSQYFGPYTSANMVRTLLVLIRQLFPLRTCSLTLTQQNIDAEKFKPCLEYHLGNCKAPCIKLQTEEDYNESIVQVKDIIKGNIHQVIDYLKCLMREYAVQYKFELADTVKQKIEILEKFQSKSTIVNPAIHNVDVFTIANDEKMAVVNYLRVVNGAIVQTHTLEIVKRIDEDLEEILGLAIVELRERLDSQSKEILIPFQLDIEFKGISFTVPRIGDKKKLIELSERNAKYYLLEHKKNLSKINPISRTDKKLEQIKTDLHLKELPVYMECFDNSNIQGTNPVAACVVFKNGAPAKSEYRHFNIKTVEGPDDFASMEEIVFRRYKRLLDENAPLPQLVVIDGGKGQLNAALASIDKLELRGKIALVGIAKRLEEIYFPGDSVPVYIDKQSITLRTIQHMRNEAHRFGITFHRNKRSKAFTQSAFEQIPGIGSKTVKTLYNKYGSISAIKEQPIEQLVEIVGKSRAKKIIEFFENNNQNISTK